MRGDRAKNLCHAMVVLTQLDFMVECEGRGVGNSDIARYVGVSRQTVNKIMNDARVFGFVHVNWIEWRDGVSAKRYTPTAYYLNEHHAEFVRQINEWLIGDA